MKEVLLDKLNGMGNDELVKKHGGNLNKLYSGMKTVLFNMALQNPEEVKKILKNMKDNYKKGDMNKDNIKKMIRMILEGSSYFDTAKEFNVSITKVRNELFNFIDLLEHDASKSEIISMYYSINIIRKHKEYLLEKLEDY